MILVVELQSEARSLTVALYAVGAACLHSQL